MVGLCAVGMVIPAWREGRHSLWVLCGFLLRALPWVSSGQSVLLQVYFLRWGSCVSGTYLFLNTQESLTCR